MGRKPRSAGQQQASKGQGRAAARRFDQGLAVALGTVALISGSGTVLAADDAEVSALRREIEALRKENATLKGLGTSAAAPVPLQAAPAEPATAARAPEKDAGTDSLALERVVVSGKRGLQAVKDIPLSISVISGEELKREDAVSLDAITKRLANVKWNYGNSQTSNYSIRGIGKIANNQAADPSVGIYADGVPFAYNPLASFNFYDVDSVEVARGPQGTLFGKNTTIGSIGIKYKRPSFTPSSEVTLGFSKYDAQDYGHANGSLKATAVSTGPIVDDVLAYRLSVNADRGGGWIINKYNPDNQYINADRVSGRVQFLLTPTADFNARLSLEVTPRMNENANIGSTNFFFRPTPAFYTNGDANLALTTEGRLSRGWFTRNASYTVGRDYLSQRAINSDSQQGLVTGTNTALLELNWNPSDKYQLSSITAFKDYYFNAFRDDEGTVFDVQTAAGNHIKYQQISQEFRLGSRVEGVVDYQFGLLLLKNANSTGSNAVYGSDGGAWFATNAQYGRLDVNSAGRSLLTDSIADLWKRTPSDSRGQSTAIYANADWKVSEPLTVNTGLRVSREERRLTSASYLVEQGYGSDLGGANNGGFDSDASGNLAATNTAAQLLIANRVSQRYFGKTYGSLSAAERRQVADAKSIRQGRVGTLYDSFEADVVNSTLYTWALSPKYKFNENVTGYVSYRHGEKAGLPGVLSTTGTPVSYEIKPEKNDAFEIGAKANLLGGDLVVNSAIYLNNIRDYQQTVFFVDETATALLRQTDPNATIQYTSGAGNVPKVRAQGVELDAVYTGFRNIQLRLAGAYNDAHYVRFERAANPVERANEGAFRDISGHTLPGASLWSFDLGANYNRPVLGDKVFHASINTAYLSRYNSDNSLSNYAWIPDHSITDVSFGIGHGRGKWDLNVFIKNVLDDDTVRNRTWNAYAPGFPRLFGITFSSRL